MKRQTYLLASLALLIGGVFAWQSFSFARLQGQLEKQTADIAKEYASIVEKDVLPLGAAHASNETWTKLTAKIKRQSATTLDSSLSVENRVQAITDLQIELNRFSTLGAASKDMAEDGLFAQLQTTVGEHGHVRTLLEGYNSTAVRWNQGAQSDLGSLFGRISGTEHPILPYLRFDGQQEFVPVISL